MVEIFVRLAVCLGFVGLALAGLAPLDASLKLAGFAAVLEFVRWRLEAAHMANPGIAGLVAVAEAAIIALFLGSAGLLHNLGFLAIVPCICAATAHGAPIVSMAPLGASAILASDVLNSTTPLPAPSTLLQAAGVLALCLALGIRSQAEPGAPMASTPSAEAPSADPFAFQIRESYRSLRDAYADLERRAQRDHIAARLAQVRQVDGDRFYGQLCTAVSDLLAGAEVALYTVARFERVLVVRSATQSFPGDVKTRSLEVNPAESPAVVREKAEDALAALAVGYRPCATVLTAGGRLVGMLCVLHAKAETVEDLRSDLAEIGPLVAEKIAAAKSDDERRRRLKELEVLYEVGSWAAGSGAPSVLAERIARELRGSLDLNGVSVILLENGEETIAAQDGSPSRLLDAMSFAGGSGLEGWMRTGFPELALFDARSDPRCDVEQALRRRIGSFFLAPLWRGMEPAGYLAASTQNLGGIDVDEVFTLRLAAAELSRAIERMAGESHGGAMSPREFSSTIEGRAGCLVYIEPLRRERIIANCGAAAFDEAVRKLAHGLRARLPADACLCRRDRGDFVAFLPTDEEFAKNWANEVAATACPIGASAGGGGPVLLPLRARTAAIDASANVRSTVAAA